MAVDAIASGGALAERILDALDLAVLGLSIDRRILFMNAKARAVVDNRLLPLLKDVIRSSHVRRSNGRRPVPVRVAIGGHETYVYAARAQGDPPLDVIFMRDAPRDADLFRLLNEKYGVTRRGYQVLARLRLGRTNRQIAAELMLTPGTVTQLVHDLLGRFQVPNRTSLVSIVEQTGMGAVWEPSR